MSAISVIPQVATMTTREIAELTGKEHKHVYRDAVRMMEQLEYTQNQINGCHQNWTHPQNNQTYYFMCLNREETECLIAGYSVPIRMKIIKRLRELESQQNPGFELPKSFSEALMLAANQAAELEAARPAVEFVEKYVQSAGNMGFRQVAKLLRIKENDFRAFLQDNQIMYMLGGEWTPYAQHINSGRFVMKVGTARNDHAFHSAKFTPKGVTWVSQLWSDK